MATRNTRLELLAPTMLAPNARGERAEGPPTVHRVWADRQDRGGRERLAADAAFGESSIVFRVAAVSRLGPMDTAWKVRVVQGRDRGHTLDILSIAEEGAPAFGAAALLLYCARRV